MVMVMIVKYLNLLKLIMNVIRLHNSLVSLLQIIHKDTL
nr:MAG TPA: hypothetical protein [Caudoviricetes sp.]